MSFVFKAAVVGAGTMGGQIAQTIAAAGIDVVLKDIKQELVDQGIEAARQASAGAFKKQVKRKKLTQEQADAAIEEIIGRIHGTLTYDGFGDVDFVIEAVPEKLEIKQAVFAELDAVTPGHAILASNTSGLAITDIAVATTRPDKVVGTHYFFPASVMPLLEIVEGELTSPETIATTYAFAQATKKQPIVVGEGPGFTVNRLLAAGLSEVFRAQEENGLSIQKIDEGLRGRALPMGPFFLLHSLGLDPSLHLQEQMVEEVDEGDTSGAARFYVHKRQQELVAQGDLGAKTGEGFFKADGSPNVDGDADPDIDELVNLSHLAQVREASLLIEDGDANHRDIDLGMAAGTGLDPRRGILPPLLKADADGLDVILERFEQAQERYGDRFEAPVLVRRLVAQGRLGAKSGQGFYVYPQYDDEQPGTLVKVETRDHGVRIAWLDNPPVNSISPDLVADLRKVWDAAKADGVRALVLASASPMSQVFSAGADIKAFTTLGPDSAKLLDDAHALLREFGESQIVTIAAVNSLAFGGGSELALAADVRIAARSAVFGQPEVKLGIIPGFGGTQRLRRLVGDAKALELNLVGDPILAEEAYAHGLVNTVVPDHELLDVALNWARRLAGQAPLAIAEIKKASAVADLDAGIQAEKDGFASVFATEDAKEGIGAFIAKREPRWQGK
ncbi:3-hydroxyacyl-CoA dehydrogenase NAD-binding domain-containing protein [Patulibacter brassicae]|jgi:enoyl-CoA hydratase/3-hydroxyacyl-CoA dehydrogenase|uniref:3-hydroxyacyl-CoA dehydrogenase NAD-binding domain-containing protein n=1 Tax=Patulibacter brassicae TaxID=1705717 RepID=A0ABU4VP22_9ACTN|nr:3-hydroxyacyl-CoA dehydrogenase NAD-binding domain-containing protein [Patulibacter brassicae]MDX8153077.1 3-hydroxyacyl-CoA dehydrogenase NAD-binding domain-containing protein [Patulibacter brassicae]